MSSYCSPTMTNSILNTTSQTSCPQLRGGLPTPGHTPGLSVQELKPLSCREDISGGPCTEMGLKMACSASGRAISKVCKLYLSEKKKPQKLNRLQDQLPLHLSDKQKTNLDKSRSDVLCLPVFPSAPYLLLFAWLILCRSSNIV